MQHNTGQGIHNSAGSTALRLITACRWRTNARWKCWHSILQAELLPTKDLHKISADLCLLLQVSCASTWTRSSKLSNVLNTFDDIGFGANNATDLTGNIRAVFQCIRNAGLELTIEKFHFGFKQDEFLG